MKILTNGKTIEIPEYYLSFSAENDGRILAKYKEHQKSISIEEADIADIVMKTTKLPIDEVSDVILEVYQHLATQLPPERLYRASQGVLELWIEIPYFGKMNTLEAKFSGKRKPELVKINWQIPIAQPGGDIREQLKEYYHQMIEMVSYVSAQPELSKGWIDEFMERNGYKEK